MQRTYRKRPVFDLKKAGRLVFTLFVVFVAYRILTPPSDETARSVSPDGSKTARLRTYYYFANQPSYKIYYRETGKHAWLGLYHLPAYTNTPPESTEASLAWGPDSKTLHFIVNGTSLWHHVFAPAAP